MTEPFATHIGRIREEARLLAASRLVALGFNDNGDFWSGRIMLSDGSELPVHVVLPPPFPDALPQVFLQSKLFRHIAHVERSGKICLAPESGILIDADRPEDIVTQALSMATDVLQKRNLPDQPVELAAEFLAYWSEPNGSTLLSACPPETVTGPVCLMSLAKDGSRSLVASSGGVGQEWAEVVGMPIMAMEDAFFIALDSLPSPPAFGERFTLQRLLSFVGENAAAEKVEALSVWLQSHGIPATVVFSAALGEKRGHVVFASTIPRLGPSAASRAEHSFRKDHVPRRLIVRRALAEPVAKLGVSRVDPAYVMPRGGAELSLQDTTVALVGCGSVGSYVAQALTAAGVGTLVLIDPEALEAANIHRHVLGASSIGQYKTSGLAKVLRERIPHVRVRSYPRKIESILEEEPEVVLSADVVLIALGDETLERRLNTFLHGKVRRIHVWLEPLGVGGHVLSLPKRGSGCFACLYRRDDAQGLVNMASLVEPGQFFQRSFAGCGGTFTPFGALDAEQGALHLSREAIALLRGERESGALLSWVTSKEQLLAAGYHLSRRGELLPVETLKRLPGFARFDCPVCSERVK